MQPEGRSSHLQWYVKQYQFIRMGASVFSFLALYYTNAFSYVSVLTSLIPRSSVPRVWERDCVLTYRLSPHAPHQHTGTVVSSLPGLLTSPSLCSHVTLANCHGSTAFTTVAGVVGWYCTSEDTQPVEPVRILNTS